MDTFQVSTWVKDGRKCARVDIARTNFLTAIFKQLGDVDVLTIVDHDTEHTTDSNSRAVRLSGLSLAHFAELKMSCLRLKNSKIFKLIGVVR